MTIGSMQGMRLVGLLRRLSRRGSVGEARPNEEAVCLLVMGIVDDSGQAGTYWYCYYGDMGQ